MNTETPKAKTSGFTKVVGVLFAIIVALMVLSANRDPVQPTQPTAAELQATAEYKRAAAGALALQKRMTDPDSFKLESAIMMKDGAACYRFRAKNKFGGYQVGFGVVPKSGIVITSDQTIFTDTWTAECGGKTGHDYTDRVSLYF